MPVAEISKQKPCIIVFVIWEHLVHPKTARSYSRTSPRNARMATLLPPPKRLKSAYSQSLKTPPPPTSSTTAPSIVVQFRSAEDGASLGPAINLAADTGRDALQMLVNKLRGEVSHLIPYSRLASGYHQLTKSTVRGPSPILLPPGTPPLRPSAEVYRPPPSSSPDQYLHP